MNTRLLLAVKAKILEEPENLRMESFHCGTAHCIGGWAQVLRGSPILRDNNWDKAQRLLDLDMPASDRLFETEYWPDKFMIAYEESAGDKQAQAKITAERIDHFIKTEGRE